VIGPWDHGGQQNESPFATERAARFDHDAELLRFFDRYLRDAEPGEAQRAPVSWFTVGAETWHTAAQWPPPSAPREFFLGAKRGLATEPGTEGRDEFTVDPGSGVGTDARWNSLINLVDAPLPPREQSALDARRLTYTSEPLRDALEVTGHPVVSLVLSANAPDTAVFAWLEDVDEAGRAWTVTEGVLRAVHRKLQPSGPYRTMTPWRSYLRADGLPLEPGVPAQLDVELLPVSWRFQPGHRLRLSLAGGEVDHFAKVPNAATRWTVMLGAGGSRMVLPITGGSETAGAPPAP
jgi:hypothetical protein